MDDIVTDAKNCLFIGPALPFIWKQFEQILSGLKKFKSSQWHQTRHSTLPSLI